MDKQSTQQVLIQSDDTSVLFKFKEVPTYKRVLKVKEKISAVPKPAIDEIKKFADAVTVSRNSLVRTSDSFAVGLTEVVKDMHAANISVYVYQLRNEYVTLAFDYFNDPIVEVATFVQTVGVDGIITDYPGTASKYLSKWHSSLNSLISNIKYLKSAPMLLCFYKLNIIIILL